MHTVATCTPSPQHLWRRLRSGVTQRTESARMWSDHQAVNANGPCRREKGGSPAFLKSCVCAPPLKRPVGDQLQLRNARATWPARPVVGARHHRRGMCAVARHAKHVGGRGRHASAWTARDGQCIRRTLINKIDFSIALQLCPAPSRPGSTPHNH